MTRTDPRGRRWTTLRVATLGLALVTLIALACSEGGGTTADNGGIGGTGVSQGPVDAFGSIFVNGIEWDLTQATVEVDGRSVNDSDLRLGMQVRVIGEIADDRLTGVANSVVHRTSLQGPIETAPIDVLPDGSRRQFDVLGRTITVGATETVFEGGASLAGLAIGQVLELSGYAAGDGSLRATRAEQVGDFPAFVEAEIEGALENLVQNPDGSGIFDIGSLTVRYSASTDFSGLTRGELANGLVVDVEGDLRASGTELDATEIESIEDDLTQQDREDFELSGLVSAFVSVSDFRVAGIPIDASAAALEPPGLVLADGVLVEVEGRLVSGVVRAERVESEDEDDEDEDEAVLEASITAVDAVAREVVILGVTVFADGDTQIQDERDALPNFSFSDIEVGDWLKIEGASVSPARVRADSISREEVDEDVVLRGTVTALDVNAPAMSILDQAIPLDAMTEYSDALNQPRTEEEFFRNPGDVSLGDIVQVIDAAASDPQVLLEADEVEID